MSLLSDFEDRIGGAVEGLFAGAFRSPVQPVEVAKALAKAMDDRRVVGVGKIYAPTSFTVALSSQDTEQLGAFAPTLAGELATYLIGHADEAGYTLAARPAVRFTVHDNLRLGRFRVSAEMAEASPPATANQADSSIAASPVATVGVGSPSPPAVHALATVTVSGVQHDVALKGDRVLIGRLATCGVCLQDANVSREHAAFVREGADWAIEDLGSTNGTLLNGIRTPQARLRDGDTIVVGVTELTYHEPKG
ncbi:MAG: DUF3662 and FHA domain-containing protein [Actinomycetota bacterium]|nr:DUF3662 and FHA domain-containing protein [Actinomycetota bacterium]